MLETTTMQQRVGGCYWRWLQSRLHSLLVVSLSHWLQLVLASPPPRSGTCCCFVCAGVRMLLKNAFILLGALVQLCGHVR